MKTAKRTVYICEGCGRESTVREDIETCEASTPSLPIYVEVGKEVLVHLHRVGKFYSRANVTEVELCPVKQNRNHHCYKIFFDRLIPMWLPHGAMGFTIGGTALLDPQELDDTWEDVTGREKECIKAHTTEKSSCTLR